MCNLLLALIFASNAFNTFALIIIMFNTKDIADKSGFIIRWLTKDLRGKTHLSSMYGKMVTREMENDKSRK